MTLHEKNQKLQSVLPTHIILPITMKVWNFGSWFTKPAIQYQIIYQFSQSWILKVGNTGKDGVHVFPHTNYQVVIPFRQVCKCLLQLPCYTQFCQSDLIKKWNHEMFLFMTSKKGKYFLEFEIGIGLLWVIVFVGKSSCMRNTFICKKSRTVFLPFAQGFPFQYFRNERHCNHLLEHVPTLMQLQPVLPTLFDGRYTI